MVLTYDTVMYQEDENTLIIGVLSKTGRVFVDEMRSFNLPLDKLIKVTPNAKLRALQKHLKLKEK